MHILKSFMVWFYIFLCRFCEASLLEFDILTQIERNKYADAFTIYEEAVKQYESLTKNKHIVK